MAVSKLVYEKWKSLATSQKNGYSVLSATYAETYNHKKKPHQPSSSEDRTAMKRKRTREKDPKAPKAATSAYMYFSKYHRNLLKTDNAELSFGDLGKTVGAMWKAASARLFMCVGCDIFVLGPLEDTDKYIQPHGRCSDPCDESVFRSVRRDETRCRLGFCKCVLVLGVAKCPLFDL